MSAARVTICDVAPARRAPERPEDPRAGDPRRARQPARGRRAAAHRGGQLRQPGPRAADGRRRGGRRGDRAARGRRLRRARAEREGLRPARDDRARRGALRLRLDRDVQPAQPERHGRGVDRRRRADRRRARTRTGSGRPSRSARRSAARSRARSTPAGSSRSPAGSRRRAPDEIVFADTIGVGVPSQVRDLVGGRRRRSASPVGVHLHNTRNTGYRERARGGRGRARRVLDASVGGIGGCPFAPARPGNICTEDLVYLLHGEGIETGIDLDALIGVAEWLEGVLGRQLEGRSTAPACSRRSPAEQRKESGMAYRLGVDVGGTFTDLFLVERRERGAQFRVKTPVDAGATPREGVLDRRPPHLRRGGDRRRRDPQHPPRHDGRDERGARVEGRARRPDHDDGLQADPAPRALADAGAARGLDHHDQARSAGLARGHPRGGRADGRPRRDRRGGRRGAGRGDRARPRRVGRRVADRRPRSTRTSTRRTRSRSARSSSASTRASR